MSKAKNLTPYQIEVGKIESIINSVFGLSCIGDLSYNTSTGHLRFCLEELSSDITFEQIFALADVLGTMKINLHPDGESYNLSEVTSDHVRSCEFTCFEVDFEKLLK